MCARGQGEGRELPNGFSMWLTVVSGSHPGPSQRLEVGPVSGLGAAESSQLRGLTQPAVVEQEDSSQQARARPEERGGEGRRGRGGMLTHAPKRPRNSVYSLVIFLPFVAAKTCLLLCG